MARALLGQKVVIFLKKGTFCRMEVSAHFFGAGCACKVIVFTGTKYCGCRFALSSNYA